MHARVRVPTALRELCGGEATLKVDLREGATVHDLLDAVGQRHPALERRVRDECRVLRPHVNLFLGDEHIRDLAGADTALSDGAEVSIIAAVSGG